MAELESPSQLSDAPGVDSSDEEVEEEEDGEDEFGEEEEGEEEEGEEFVGAEGEAEGQGEGGGEEEEEGGIISRKGGRKKGGGGRKRAARAKAERAGAGEPKRPQNAYMFWNQAVRGQVREQSTRLLIFFPPIACPITPERAQAAAEGRDGSHPL
jgi:hypothetical protein